MPPRKATRSATNTPRRAHRTPKRAPQARPDARSSLGPGGLTPPSSGSQHGEQEEEPPRMLMSPPPEEMLRTSRNKSNSTRASSTDLLDVPNPLSTPTPKRKRTRSTPKADAPPLDEDGVVASSSRVTLDATPNPKLRKQPKLHVSFAEDPPSPTKTPSRTPRLSTSTRRSSQASSHAANPPADYTSPRSRERATSHRRLTTPVPYEPPADRFTPPREVFTPVPSVSKSSKRKALFHGSVNGKRLILQIKKEPPEVNLNEPPPPPSPTEDPLLLKGPPPSTKRKPQAHRVSLASIPSARSRDTPPISSSPVRASSQPRSPIRDLDFANAGPDSSSDDQPLPPFHHFDRAVPVDDAQEWTDEDDDEGTEFDHAGEYTGKFKIITVPTKQDPPSSITRRRQDMWGRPISPFPYEKRHPSAAARTHSPIPESPVRETGEDEETELPVAEYDDEELPPGPSRWRSPTPPPHGSPPQNVEDEDIEMERDDGGSSLPSSSPRKSPSPLPIEAVSGPSGSRHSATPEGVEATVSVETVVEVDIEVDVSLPRQSPAASSRLRALSEERMVDEAQPMEESPGGYPQEERSELSYVDPADLARPVPRLSEESGPAMDMNAGPTAARAEEAGTTQSSDASEASPADASRSAIHSDTQRRDTCDGEGGTVDSRFDFPSGSEASEEPGEAVGGATEWSFSVPQLENRDAVMQDVEEEDAATVVRELSREPDEHGDPKAPLPAPDNRPSEPQLPEQPMGEAAPSALDTSQGLASVTDAGERRPLGTVQQLAEQWSRLQREQPSLSSAVPASTSKPVRPSVPTPPSKPLQASRPAPPASRVPEVTFSPRNPFQTPGITQTSSALRPAAAREFRPLQTAPTPQFDLPEDEIDESLLDPGIVKISSSDPMAAARAAAILRLHKYDCVEAIGSPSRQANASLQSALKSARRKSLLQSGISKSFSRRGTVGGVIGNTVIMDGAPPTTLTELLKEAEQTVLLEESSLHGLSPPKARPAPPTKTPAWTSPPNPRFEAARSVFDAPRGPRQWSKADWKALDMCYTDERVDLGKDRGLESGSLASAEEVDEERVVERFVQRMGGVAALETLGEAWSRDNLLRRVRALRRKQSAGNHAPPSRTAVNPDESMQSPAPNYSTFFSPNATMLGSVRQPESRSLAAHDQPPVRTDDVRYNELMQEAVEFEKEGAVARGELVDRDPDVSMAEQADAPPQEQDRSFISPLLPGRAAHSLATKVKGLVFSYLRSPQKTSSKDKTGKPAVNGPILPVPPPEVFQKPRPPITTPVPKPAEKPAPPKALVQLQHVPPPKPSMIPRLAQPPQMWVKLNHVEPRPSSSMGANAAVLRERRDSGASVKDLVQTFEQLDKLTAAERAAQKRLEQLKKKQSAKKWRDAQTAKASRPAWR